MDSLYHYTTFAALDGILSSKTIWLSNLRHVNDKKEMQYFYDCLKKDTIEILSEKKDEIEKLFSQQWDRFKNETAYAFSLSKAEEDATQWDRYANKGKGVCIKFNPQKLNKCVSGRCFTQPVFYEESVSNHQLEGIIVSYIISGELSGGFDDIEGVFFNAWICSGAFKQPSFRAEQEVRIYAHHFDEFRWEPLQYRASFDGLKEFLPVRLCKEDENDYGGAIEGITIGPNAGVDCELLERYLKAKKIDVSQIEIKKSTCSLAL